jgi:hypothetical protein
MHVRDNPWGKPIEFRGTDFDKSGDRPHESYIKTVVRTLLLFDGRPVDFKLGRVAFFVLLVEIGDYVIDFTLFRLRNLQHLTITLGSPAINSSRSFLIYGRSSNISIITCSSSWSVSILAFEYWNRAGTTFYRLESITKSAISLRSYGSVVFCDVLRIVAPKGCFLIPSDLKFSINKKRATMRCWFVRSYIQPDIR